jgi:cytochrome c2
MTPSQHKRVLFLIAAGLVAAAAFAVIVVRERRPTVGRYSIYVVGDPERGASLFFGDKKCSICHSINGQGGRIAPDLSATRPALPAMGWLATVLWNHAPGMFRRIRQGTSYPQLDPQQMADILAFLYEAGNADRRGDPNAGEIVFQQKGCARCHTVRSSGGKSAPELSAIMLVGNEWMSAMWNHSQAMIDPITKVLGSWPQFKGSEMSDLVAYIGGEAISEHGTEVHGNALRGWKVFQAKCMQCHSVRGQGGKVGPELGPERKLPLTTAEFASVLWNHAPAMLRLSHERGIALPALERTEMPDLVAFLASLRYSEPTGSPLVGERIFSVRGCAQCHGSTAEGTPLGPRLRSSREAYTAVSFTAALWKHGPRMVDRTEAMGIRWPTLEATDLGDLVSFLNAAPH